MEGFQFIDIILLAMVAGFIVLRLRSVLGRRTGHEPDRDGPAAGPAVPGTPSARSAGSENVVPLPAGLGRRRMQNTDIEPAYVGTPLEPGMVMLKAANPSFSAEEFLRGASQAFEMIIAAYAKNDTDALRPLLSSDVYAQFANAIQGREDRGETLHTELVVLKPAKIEAVEMRGSVANVSVMFQSEQSNVVKNAAGQVVEGSADHVESITDIWTFSRDTRSSDPNWTLVATRSVD